LSYAERVKEEVQRYSAVPALDADADALDWWDKNAPMFPELSKLAKKYLAIPATSTSVERFFSQGGQIICDERRLITGEHAEQLIFLKMNGEIIPKPT